MRSDDALILHDPTILTAEKVAAVKYVVPENLVPATTGRPTRSFRTENLPPPTNTPTREL
ncbi:hypothetical protein ACIRRA_43295 [Nocardia sp. NPDC101769]|uniref:hypothetical protein n=1 Tax=Nocardia sp. NPDC101769 TaxID=3364333 RepID=UPI003824F72C